MLNRTEKIEIRVTPEFKAIVKDAAKQNGMNVSAFVIRTLEHRLRREPKPKNRRG